MQRGGSVVLVSLPTGNVDFQRLIPKKKHVCIVIVILLQNNDATK